MPVLPSLGCVNTVVPLEKCGSMCVGFLVVFGSYLRHGTLIAKSSSRYICNLCGFNNRFIYQNVFGINTDFIAIQ